MASKGVVVAPFPLAEITASIETLLDLAQRTGLTAFAIRSRALVKDDDELAAVRAGLNSYNSRTGVVVFIRVNTVGPDNYKHYQVNVDLS